ncbi:MAG: class I SAM-dependent methyltransferase [Gammaproteobacteria bacterium]|nr:class I SAM-dependent methyltransferase [Gammaproteobacteria bacterium]
MQALLAQLQLVQLSEETQRLFHGRGKCFSGLEQVTIDYFAPSLFITLFSEHESSFEQQILATLSQAYPEHQGPILIQRRYLERSPVEVVRGEQVPAAQVIEHGLSYQVKLLDGQNNGLFLDMANGRRWIEQHAKDRNVLNLFSYSCSFSVAALAAGAKQVINIDMSHGALKLGKINHQLNDLDLTQTKFFRHDIFKSWGKLKRYGPYQTIVFDPPTNQWGSFTAAKDYARLLRKIPDLATPNADLLICLNSPDLGRDFIADLMAEHAPECELVAQVANPAVFQEIDPDKGLKVFHYRYLGQKTA